MMADGNPTPEMVAALAELAKQAIPPMTPARQREGFAAVSARLAAARGRRWSGRPRARWVLAGVGALASAAALWLVLVRGGARAAEVIAFHAEAGEILDGGYLRSYGGDGMSLRFSEGTVVAFLPGARGRLRDVDALGARLAVEQGQARIVVAERPGAHWLIDAGPFVITVKGTIFTVAWDVKTEQLDLRMEEGVVEVTGPILENLITVRGGQRLAINLPRKEVVLHDLAEPVVAAVVPPAEVPQPVRPAAAAPAAAAPKPASRNVGGAESPAVRRSARAHPPGSFGWAALLAAGDVDTILGDLERVGVKRSLGEASSDDLSALADAARYRRQEDLARQALLAQRSRFAGTSRACDAAFLLGRLEESHEGRGLKALEWYDQYLEGAPTGAYASEALGRKMMATQKLMGSAAARVVAQQYLARFPTGSYAGAARALRQAP